MNSFADFHFIRPLWLIALPIVIGLWWLVKRSSDPLRGWRPAISPALLDALTVGRDSRERWRNLSILTGWIIATLAIAGPTWKPEPSPFADDPVPVMLILKASESMDLTDLSPSRLERAQLKIADFAEERKGQPLGLIAYSGTSHLVLPPTRDTSVVATMAANISPDIMPKEGDDLVAALELAQSVLAKQGGSIVVFLDNIPASDEAALSTFRQGNSLPVHLLGVAMENSPELEAIRTAASALGATTTLIAADSSDVESLVKRTARAPVAVAAAGEGVRWSEAGWWFVPLLATLLLLTFRREEITTGEEVPT